MVILIHNYCLNTHFLFIFIEFSINITNLYFGPVFQNFYLKFTIFLIHIFAFVTQLANILVIMSFLIYFKNLNLIN